MPAALRQHCVIASYLYFLTLALYLLPALYMMLAPLLKPLPATMGAAEISLVVLTCVLMLAASVWIGIGMRAGKRWAKGLFLLFLAAIIYQYTRMAPNLFQHGLWWALRQLLPLSLQLATAFFLFKHSLVRRPSS